MNQDGLLRQRKLLYASKLTHMKEYTGVVKAPIIVDSNVHISGVAQGGALIQETGSLHISGIISGPLTVSNGGHVTLSGVASGSLSLHPGGTLDVSGVFNGPVMMNEGIFLAAVGSVIHGQRVTAAGAFGTPVTSWAVVIDASTPRFKVTGIGTRLSLTDSMSI